MDHQPTTSRCRSCGRALTSRGRWCRACAEHASQFIATSEEPQAVKSEEIDGLGIGACLACGRPISASSTWCRSCSSRVTAFLTHYRYPRRTRTRERSRAELTDKEVRRIRGLGDRVDLREVAEVFGVSVGTIEQVREEAAPRSGESSSEA